MELAERHPAGQELRGPDMAATIVVIALVIFAPALSLVPSPW